MKCQSCGENEASFKYTEISNGNKNELFLCEECSKKMGFDNVNIPISFSSFFAELFENPENSEYLPLMLNLEQLKCDVCNMSYEEFIKTGEFGCANCYNVFNEKLEPILKKIQNNTRHIGKKGNKIVEDEEIEIKESNEILKLKTNLKRLIKEEKYEEAAKVRDEIKSLEKGQVE